MVCLQAWLLSRCKQERLDGCITRSCPKVDRVYPGMSWRYAERVARKTRAGSESGGSKRALLALLRRGGRLGDAGQVIVYATFQKQAAGVAAFLDANGVSAAAYHANKAMQVGRASQAMKGIRDLDCLGRRGPCLGNAGRSRPQCSAVRQHEHFSCISVQNAVAMQQACPRRHAHHASA